MSEGAESFGGAQDDRFLQDDGFVGMGKRKPAVVAGFRVLRGAVGLELFEEVASRAGNVDSAGNTALAVLDALDDAGGLGALGTIGALLGVHDLLAVTGFGDLCHCVVLPAAKVWLARFMSRARRCCAQADLACLYL